MECLWMVHSFHTLFEFDEVYPFTWIFPITGCGGKLLLRVKMKYQYLENLSRTAEPAPKWFPRSEIFTRGILCMFS